MSLSKEDKENVLERLLNKYLRSLQTNPLITKACTSAFVSSLGQFVSQKIAPNPDGRIAWRSVASYGAFGFCVSAPIIHYFYIFLEKTFPKKEKTQRVDMIKRLLIDRVVFTPPFILLFLTIVPLLEGQGLQAAIAKIKEFYWTILVMNWKVWTLFTFINVNYIPPRYRVLFGNIIGLFWSIYVAVKRRQMAAK